MLKKQELNKGDLVKIRDYSCSLRLGLVKVSNMGCYEPNAEQTFKVLIVGCEIPTYMLGSLQRYANTIVMGQDDNIVWLVHSRLVEVINPKAYIEKRYFIDGKDVTSKLSDQTKQAL